MDPLDFALLRALHRSPRATYGELGSAIGLSANAAKARIHRMMDEGVVQGFAAAPRASLLALHEGLLLFTGVDDLDEREDEILRGLAEVPGVRYTDAAIDHALYVWILYRDEADWERIERAAVSLAGKPPSRSARAETSATDRALAAADWKVVRALAPDGRAHVKTITARSGLTFKPLKRRLDALLRAGDVRIAPVVSPADAPSTSLYRIVCFLAPDAPAPEIEDAIVTIEAPRVACVLAQRPTLRAARDLARALNARPGIERAQLQLATRRASHAWVEDAIARAAIPNAPVPVPLPRAR